MTSEDLPEGMKVWLPWDSAPPEGWPVRYVALADVPAIRADERAKVTARLEGFQEKIRADEREKIIARLEGLTLRIDPRNELAKAWAEYGVDAAIAAIKSTEHPHPACHKCGNPEWIEDTDLGQIRRCCMPTEDGHEDKTGGASSFLSMGDELASQSTEDVCRCGHDRYSHNHEGDRCVVTGPTCGCSGFTTEDKL